MLSDFDIQPIEVFDVKTTRKERIKREEWWMKELKTLYPYGLNDRCDNAFYSDYQKERLVSQVFNKLVVKRKQKGGKWHKHKSTRHKTQSPHHKKTNNTRCSLASGYNANAGLAPIINSFINKLNNMVKNNKNWRRYCYSFVNQVSLRLLRRLRRDSAILKNMTENNNNVLHLISDLINHRLFLAKQQQKSKKCHFLKIRFDNKGIEDVNIQSLLHKVNDAIPTSFTNREPPTVIFTRTPYIGSKIFNYKNVVKDLQASEWCSTDHKCDCSNSPFTDPNHGHIVTGNLNVIANHKLRGLLSKGPSYRETNKIDWGKVFLCIKRGVVDCAKSWCAKQEMDICVLTEWKSRLLMEVKTKIKVLKKKYRRTPIKVLDDILVKSYLDDFHEKFVITPTDKAGNNFSIVCKKFYIQCLLKELGMLDSKVKKGSKTYEFLGEMSETDIVKKHVKYMNQHGIELMSSQESLPFLYRIPKMHKNPSKQRYIAASHSCSTKPLSKMITYCLKLVQHTHTKYCNMIAKDGGFQRMWIVDNSVEVLKKISDCNKKAVRNVRTYDFSTLYTSIPHVKLKERMAMVINQCFNVSDRRYIRIDKSRARWSRVKGKNNHS